ncbi:MAG: asparaginase [Hydrogenophaga sp.]|uniref:asparaginase n=1 Tax=Hydrogenophaga sp. TaxID=1904254 RepID=UPI0025B7DEA9|nr:asparaginase [Hydrogenophaga sp.]MBU7574264.1 asparaginase [Hydrogenophaga sp.]
MVDTNQGRRLVILGTGGTIAGRAAQAGDNVGYVAGQVGVADLVAAVPALAGVPLEVEQVAQVDSKDMGLPVWRALVARLRAHLDDPQVSAVIVTHGTDTLEETAFVLQRLLQPTKPVVLTCAMRPASALVPDGPQNLADALAVVRQGEAGVVVVCAGLVHGALEVAKVHTYRLDAFDSGDAGPLACVEEGEVRRFRHRGASVPSHDPALLARFLAADALPRVELVTSHADADGSLVRALMAPGAARPLRGIVVAGTGNGTVHQALSDALNAAQTQGVRVVLATRCARGRVVPHAGLPFEHSAGLSPVKARLALALDLLMD